MHHPELIVLGVDGAVPHYIREKVSQGKFPHFAELMKRGTFMDELRPVHPTVTPVCWSAFQTGSTPEVNGIVSDLLHLDGPLSHQVSSYNGNYLKTERFWEAAARAGKSSLVVSFPVTAPARSPLVRQVGGETCSSGRFLPQGFRFEQHDIPLQLWFFDLDKKPVKSLKHFTVNSSPVIKVSEHVSSHNQKLSMPQSASEVTPLQQGRYRLQVDLDRPNVNYHRFEPFYWDVETSENGFALHTENGILPLNKDEWTPPFQRTLKCEGGERRCAFRFGCFAYEDGWLVYSYVTSHISESVTPSLRPVIEKMPPPPINLEYIFLMDPVTFRLGYDAFNFNVHWNEEVIRQALEQEASDIVVTYVGNTDTFNHLFWSVYCGATPASKEAKQYAADCLEKAFEIADRHLGFLMDEIADEHTTILVLSDHGSIGVPHGHDFNEPLVKAGLLSYKNSATREIDWEKTRAAACGFGHFFVNLQGRETNGIVPPEDYDKTVYEIIKALQDNMRGPDGASYLAFSVRKSEAGFFEQGGERSGDVVYGAAAGYSSITVHAEQIPTARHPQFGSILALGILAGPGVPANQTLAEPVRLQDLAPTVCSLLGYPLPEGSNGRIVSKLIQAD